VSHILTLVVSIRAIVPVTRAAERASMSPTQLAADDRRRRMRRLAQAFSL
jgi:hypothetical protein